MDRRRFLGLVGAATASTVATGAVHGANEGYGVERTDVSVESFDGTTIETTVFEPENDGSYPAVLATHGWGGSRDQNFGEGEQYAADGYVLLTFDSRGFGESEGEVGVDGPKEVRDVAALIDYLADHPKVATDRNGDPRVGMFGGSYAGGIQLNAAAYDDRIDVIVPEICWHSLNYALQPNGVVKTAWGAGLYAVGIGGSRQHEFTSGDVPGLREGMDPQVHRGIAEGVALNGFTEETQAYFALRSPKHKLDRIDVPTLFIQGWTDHLFVPNEAVRNFQGLQDRGVETKLLFYNEGHEQIPVDGEYPQAVDVSDEARKAWLDAHLKRGTEAVTARKRLETLFPESVTYYATQTEQNLTAEGLPPADSESKAVTLSAVAGEGSSPVLNGPGTSNSYVVKQSYDTPGSSVDFDVPAERLGADAGRVELLGTPTLDLEVTPLGREAFLFCKLYHVAADGTETHVDDQVTPLRVTASPDDVGSVQTVSVDLVTVQRFLEAGETLRLTVAGADAGFNVSRQAAGALVDHASTLSLPVRDA